MDGYFFDCETGEGEHRPLTPKEELAITNVTMPEFPVDRIEDLINALLQLPNLPPSVVSKMTELKTGE